MDKTLLSKMFKELKQFNTKKTNDLIIFCEQTLIQTRRCMKRCSTHTWMGKCKSKAEKGGVHELDWLVGSRREQQECRLMCGKSPDTVGRTKTSKVIAGNRAFSEQEENKIKTSPIRHKLNGNEIAVLHFAF